MDELTKHLIELQQEQKDYPERFSLNVICDNCGRTHIEWFPKDEIEKFVAKHGNRDLHQWECEKCHVKDEEEE